MNWRDMLSQLEGRDASKSQTVCEIMLTLHWDEQLDNQANDNNDT